MVYYLQPFSNKDFLNFVVQPNVFIFAIKLNQPNNAK